MFKMNLLLLSGILLMYSQNDAGEKINLDEYRWKNRLILIFTNSNQDSVFLSTMNEIERLQEEMDDRDLIVFTLFKESISYLNKKPIHSASVDSLYKRYLPGKEQLTMILIGKDGGEKMRQTGQVSFQALFDRIDAMPMRRREMRE